MFNFFRRSKVRKVVQPSPHVSFDAAMVYLGMDEPTLKRKICAGDLRAYRDGNSMVFRLDDLEAYNLNAEERVVIDG